MHVEKYGPFIDVVAVASALAATFSLFLVKSFGSLKRWTWLTSGAPSFLVSAAPRAVAVTLMAFTYVIIRKENLKWFAGAAVICGLLAFVAIAIFDRQRERHVAVIPQVAPDSTPLVDHKNDPVVHHVVVGSEATLRKDAKTAFDKARKQSPGLSLMQFMSGFGPQHLNDPNALW